MKSEAEKRRLLIRFAEALQACQTLKNAEKYENSFHEFVKAAWEHFDPAPFQDNWHLRDLCRHMEQVARGTIKRFLINVPPRTAKSNIISICYPAWVWAQRTKGPQSGPQVSFFYASYAEALALEHSLKCRRLVESRWYQKHWGRRFKLVSDRNTKGHFENDKGGYRMASSVDARATGWGAMCVFADDPHLVKEAESEEVRGGVVRWWNETIPSRLNDRKTGVLGVVMQRVHEADVAGDIIFKEEQLRKLSLPGNYVHFCVPMTYIPVKHVNAWDNGIIRTFVDDEIASIPEEAIFWEDPRKEDGELLWPARYPTSEVDKLEHEIGEYAFACQYLQRPAPRGGGIIKKDWWQLWDDESAAENGAAPGTYPPFEYLLASLDTAYTEKEENDPSALSIWGMWRDKNGNPQIMLVICWAERLQIHNLVLRVGAECKRFKVDKLLVEDKAAGHSVAQELNRLFSAFDFSVELINPRSGFIKSPDKVARLQTVAHLFAEGLVWAPDKTWADEMINQVAAIPRAAHDDLADSMSQALIYLRRNGWIQRKEERTLEVEEELRYRPKLEPLYPA